MAEDSNARRRLQAEDLHPDVFELFDRYVHGFIVGYSTSGFWSKS